LGALVFHRAQRKGIWLLRKFGNSRESDSLTATRGDAERWKSWTGTQPPAIVTLLALVTGYHRTATITYTKPLRALDDTSDMAKRLFEYNA
jgi:hypothetical protein